MAYIEKNFSQCAFNPLAKDLFKTYPKLKALTYAREMKPEEEWEKLIRYIIALYDPGSPVINDNTDLTLRKQVAAQVAGFNVELDNEYLMPIYTCDDEEFTDVVILYLKLYGNSRLWSMIQSNEHLFWEYNLRLMTPISRADKDRDLVAAVSMKSKMSEDLEVISDRIDRCMKRFYVNDEVLEDAVKKKKITPESIANV